MKGWHLTEPEPHWLQWEAGIWPNQNRIDCNERLASDWTRTSLTAVRGWHLTESKPDSTRAVDVLHKNNNWSWNKSGIILNQNHCNGRLASDRIKARQNKGCWLAAQRKILELEQERQLMVWERSCRVPSVVLCVAGIHVWLQRPVACRGARHSLSFTLCCLYRMAAFWHQQGLPAGVGFTFSLHTWCVGV